MWKDDGFPNGKDVADGGGKAESELESKLKTKEAEVLELTVCLIPSMCIW